MRLEGLGAVILLAILGLLTLAEKRSKKREDDQPAMYRRNDLIVGPAGPSGHYNIYSMTEGFEIVFSGTHQECQRFMKENTI